MGRGILITLLRWVSLALILAAAILAVLQFQDYQRSAAIFPDNTLVAGIPIGELTRQQAVQRLEEFYSLPVELHYGEAVIHLDPSQAGFQLAMGQMLAEAAAQTHAPLLGGFWSYLQGVEHSAVQIPLQASFSVDKLREYLHTQIAPRYDRSAVPPIPIPGTVSFHPGQPGETLDIDRSLALIEKSLFSTTDRVVDLPIHPLPPPPPALANLEILLKQTLDTNQFDGLAGLYLKSLQDGQTIRFAHQQGVVDPANPDIAFSAASIMKIPIMVSVFKRLDRAPDTETEKLLKDMIQESGNEAADWVMQRVIDPDLAPLQVSEDMHALGLENTFLAGYFYSGAPILKLYDTPANQREDFNTDPDVYSQTTPSDMGILLESLYRCSQSSQGLLIETFPGEITQAECQDMIAYLSGNKTPYLIEAGVPEVVDVVHKHGWVSYQGVINAIGDAAIIYSPSNDYVLVIFLHRDEGLVWESASHLFSQLSQAVYNFYSISGPG